MGDWTRSLPPLQAAQIVGRSWDHGRRQGRARSGAPAETDKSPHTRARVPASERGRPASSELIRFRVPRSLSRGGICLAYDG